MAKYIIYGAGITGQKTYNSIVGARGCGELSHMSPVYSAGGYIENIWDDGMVIAFADSNPKLWGTEVFGLPVLPPDEIKNYDYDFIAIGSTMSVEAISNKLVSELGVPPHKIEKRHVACAREAREIFLRSFAAIAYDRNLKGSVAEGGVCEGEFAKKINACFPDRTLYLFDTFEGFDARDTEFEKAKGYSGFDAGYLNISSEEKVRKALPHPEKAVFRKGYFPETAAGIDDEFVFANLDFDLYKPTIAGLEFFWARLVPGGAMLVHDFAIDMTKGIRAACYEFSDRHGVGVAPIGDGISVVFAKNR